MSDDLRSTIKRAFAEFGVQGEVHVAVPVYPDEAVFVVSTDGTANMREDELVRELMRILRRKVWVATNGPVWEGQTIRLDEVEPQTFAK